MPVRVPVAAFVWRRHWRRTLNANADLVSEQREAKAHPEAFDLFHRYQAGRHGSEGMGAMTYSDFRAMIEDSPAATALIEYRDRCGSLLGALLADHVADGWSAVYSFFEPSQPRRSMGNYMILDLIRRTAAENRSFVYLGYWIEHSAKMAYKARFSPVEAMSVSGWQTIDALRRTVEAL